MTSGFGATAASWDTDAVLHVVEMVAAFTLLGYMLAELRGRREARFREGIRYIAVASAGAAAVTELLEGFRPDGGASALRLALLVVAALYGSWLYHLQRAHVRQLLGSRVISLSRAADSTGTHAAIQHIARPASSHGSSITVLGMTKPAQRPACD